MKKLFTFVFVLTILFSFSSCIDDSFKQVDDKLGTVKEQIANIDRSLKSLESIQSDLNKLIKSLESSDNAQDVLISSLQSYYSGLEKMIEELKAYSEAMQKSDRDWASQTFSTLEQQREIFSIVNNIKLQIANLETSDDNLQGALQSLESKLGLAEESIKKWVGEQLAGYCTLEEYRNKISQLEKLISDGEAQNKATAANLEAVKDELSTLKTKVSEMEKEVKSTIDKLISSGKKYTDDAVASVNSKLDTLGGELSDLNDRVMEMFNILLDKLLNMVQSIDIAPDYAHREIAFNKVFNNVTLLLTCKNKNNIEKLVKLENFKDSMKFKVRYLKTKADPYPMTADVLDVRYEEAYGNYAVIKIRVDGVAIDKDFFAGNLPACAQISLNCNETCISTPSFDLVPQQMICAIANKDFMESVNIGGKSYWELSQSLLAINASGSISMFKYFATDPDNSNWAYYIFDDGAIFAPDESHSIFIAHEHKKDLVRYEMVETESKPEKILFYNIHGSTSSPNIYTGAFLEKNVYTVNMSPLCATMKLVLRNDSYGNIDKVTLLSKNATGKRDLCGDMVCSVNGYRMSIAPKATVGTQKSTMTYKNASYSPEGDTILVSVVSSKVEDTLYVSLNSAEIGTKEIQLPYRTYEAGKTYVQDINFSLEDTHEYTDLAGSETANCYIVDSAGYYRFPAVKGNNKNAFLDGIASVNVIWENCGSGRLMESTITSMGVEKVSGKPYIKFHRRNTEKANVLLAAKDKDGNILWSWHLWMLDKHDINNYPEDITICNGTLLSDMNLGAVRKDPEALENPGQSAANRVNASGLFYQWGRKDPFTYYSSHNRGEGMFAIHSDMDMFHTYDYAVKHPTHMIVDSTEIDWTNTHAQFIYRPSAWRHMVAGEDPNLAVWNSESKSVDDPCPPGYMVAANDAFTKDFLENLEEMDNSWVIKLGNDTLFIPRCGNVKNIGRRLNTATGEWEWMPDLVTDSERRSSLWLSGYEVKDATLSVHAIFLAKSSTVYPIDREDIVRKHPEWSEAQVDSVIQSNFGYRYISSIEHTSRGHAVRCMRIKK